ncbi:TylF/MycF family methyltransferase [Helicobacter saguini]|uniref:TylF/MycF family methyltransferase n=2 Tax=Helicobacter saguini TaxID=1548018 RepID=UPI001F3FE9F1|nr:TylF/MycF family methyltransferase [Helicobacter saguini]
MKINNFDTDKSFMYENGFYLSSNDRRIGKMLAHYELYKRITHLPGDIVECGVFKGNSFFRFAHFRNILECQDSRKIIGFDIFGKFPSTNFDADKGKRQAFIDEAGAESISIDSMHKALKYKNIRNYELVKGNILESVPKYCAENPQLKISLLHIDTDVYEPAVCILENMYDKVVGGGGNSL